MSKTKPESIISYKAFDKDMKCRGFQYEVGKTYKEEVEVEACRRGFHACEYPLNVLSYYPVVGSKFAVVEQSGTLAREKDGDTKVASSEITIKASITLSDLIKASVEYTMKNAKKAKENGKDNAFVSNSGNNGAASNSGYRGAASNSGYRGAASNSGNYGAASNSGNYGAASNSGNYGAASNSGYRGAASNSGNYGAALSTGWFCSSETDNKHSVAIGVGYQNKAKASHGNWIVLAERDREENILSIKTAQAGVTKGIKPDTWYVLTGGKFKEYN